MTLARRSALIRWWLWLLLGFIAGSPLRADDVRRSGSLAAANANVRVSMPAVGSVGFQVTGTFNLTLAFEASIDGTNFVAVPATNLATAAKATTTTATGIYVVHAPGARYIQARVSAWTSGTAVVTANASQAVLESGALGTSGSGSMVDTEISAGAALADDTANPTTSLIGALSFGWDGANWDRTNTFPGSIDSRSASTITGLNVQSFPYGFNGTSWDRLRTEASPYPTGTLRVVAGGYTKVVSATLTRPANTTAYASGDEVTDTGGGILTFTSAARASGLSGVITGCAISFSSNWATKPSLELWVFDTTGTPDTDNSAFTPSDGESDTLLGVIPLSTAYQGDATMSTGNFTMDSGQVNIPYVTVGSANLFGRLVIRNAGQAGANSDTLLVRLRLLQD